MRFFQKNVSSSSLPSSPSPASPGSSSADRRGRSSFTHKRLTRQRKLRHVSGEEILGIHLADRFASLPGSPDCARRLRGAADHWSSSAVPQPLPLPESSLAKRLEFHGSHLGHALPGSPEEGCRSILRRNSADHIPAKSPKCSSNPRRSFSHDPSVEGNDYNLRLSIPARSAPTSGFSSPALSPRRSNVGECFPYCVGPESAKSWSNCRQGMSHDLTVENGNCKSTLVTSPRSAPTSGFSSPVVSPQRSNTGDFPLYLVARAEHQFLPFQEVHTSQASPVKSVHSPDYSPVHSPVSQSLQHINLRNHNRFSFPLHRKEWPESSSHANAHPLPLPPGASPSHSSVPSSPAVHHAIEKPIVSSRKSQWLKGKLIGRGTYGSVYHGTNRETGASCAIKEVDIIPDDPKSAECIKQLEQEIRVLQNLKHQNIVQYYGSEIVDDHFNIYLEYVHPGSISKYVREHCGDMTESIVRNFTRHILSGLAYLHSTKTIHRDIKGANLLVDSSGIVKLADFGTAKHLTGLCYELSLKGSPHWMAPEVIKAVMQKDASPDLAFAVDIWSLGCTIIEMFTGKPPWGELHGPSAMFKALNKTPPIPEALSLEGKDFLCCCFQRNPADRPSAFKLLDHAFVRNSNDINVSACIHALSATNLMDKPSSSGDCTKDKGELAPTSAARRIANGKLPCKSETTQQSHAKTFAFNCAEASHRATRSTSTLECLPHVSRTEQAHHGSHNFSSYSNVSSNVPLSTVNNHPLALMRSHGREIPHI